MKSHLLEDLETPRNATHEHPKKGVGMCVGPVFSSAPTFLGERCSAPAMEHPFVAIAYPGETMRWASAEGHARLGMHKLPPCALEL